MSTRSNIGILNNDGTVTAVYVHMDGYPEGMGNYLLNLYNTKAKIRARLKLGNSSTVNSGYHKDRGEDSWKAESFANKTEYLTERVFGWVEYQYLYEAGEWHVYKVPGDESQPSTLMGKVVDVLLALQKETAGA